MSTSYTGGLTEKLRRAEALTVIVLAKTATDIAAGAAEKTPPKIDTGALQSGWQARPISDLEWEVINPVEYAPYVEYGSHHPPRATRGGDGMDVTEEYTIAPHPMLHPSAEDARPGFEAAIARVFQ